MDVLSICISVHQKRVSDPTELKLQIVVSFYVGAKNWTRTSGRTAALYCSFITPVLGRYILQNVIECLPPRSFKLIVQSDWITFTEDNEPTFFILSCSLIMSWDHFIGSLQGFSNSRFLRFFIFLVMCISVLRACMYTHHLLHWIPWNCGYKWLWETVGIDSWSSTRATSAFSYFAITLAPKIKLTIEDNNINWDHFSKY